jgi:hypothetical protein
MSSDTRSAICPRAAWLRRAGARWGGEPPGGGGSPRGGWKLRVQQRVRRGTCRHGDVRSTVHARRQPGPVVDELQLGGQHVWVGCSGVGRQVGKHAKNPGAILVSSLFDQAASRCLGRGRDKRAAMKVGLGEQLGLRRKHGQDGGPVASPSMRWQPSSAQWCRRAAPPGTPGRAPHWTRMCCTGTPWRHRPSR